MSYYSVAWVRYGYIGPGICVDGCNGIILGPFKKAKKAYDAACQATYKNITSFGDYMMTNEPLVFKNGAKEAQRSWLDQIEAGDNTKDTHPFKREKRYDRKWTSNWAKKYVNMKTIRFKGDGEPTRFWLRRKENRDKNPREFYRL